MNTGKPRTVKPLAKASDNKKDSAVLAKKQASPAIAAEKKDSSINIGTAVVIDKTPAQNSPADARKDTADLVNKTAIAKPPVEGKPDSAFNPPVKRLRPLVNKVAELLTDTSYIAVFVDESKDKFDTIRISIPFNELLAFSRMQKTLASQPAATDKKVKDSIVQNPVDLAVRADTKKDSATIPAQSPGIKQDSTAVPGNKLAVVDSNTAIPVPEKKELSNVEKSNSDSLRLPKQAPTTSSLEKDSALSKPAIDSPTITRSPVTAAKKDSVALADSTTASKTATQMPLANTDCKEIASDADIDKLRIKMMVVSTDEDRIALAKRLFKLKCLLTKQVRALSELFRSDEGKYKWLDATYAFVSDAGAFPALGDIIKDEYYLNRFKAMLRH